MICRKEKWKAESQTVYLEIAEFLIHSQKLKEKIKPQFSKDNRNSQKNQWPCFCRFEFKSEDFLFEIYHKFCKVDT